MSRDSIKMVAMLTMLINHIANVFLPAGQPLTNLCLCIGYFTAVTMCFFLVAARKTAAMSCTSTSCIMTAAPAAKRAMICSI